VLQEFLGVLLTHGRKFGVIFTYQCLELTWFNAFLEHWRFLLLIKVGLRDGRGLGLDRVSTRYESIAELEHLTFEA
jgi:hypothetical protein